MHVDPRHYEFRTLAVNGTAPRTEQSGTYLSGGIIRSRYGRLSSGKRNARHKFSRQRVCRRVVDIFTHRSPDRSRFGRDGSNYLPEIRFHRRRRSVLRISRKGKEAYGRENGQNGNDHDKFREGEARFRNVRMHDGEYLGKDTGRIRINGQWQSLSLKLPVEKPVIGERSERVDEERIEFFARRLAFRISKIFE